MTDNLDDPLAGLEGRRAKFGVEVAPDPQTLPAVEGLLAGAATADITPPPGLPKAGYSTNATDGVGFRTRLRARVVHLRSGTTSLAIVHCDLLGGSSVLQHLVARRIAHTTDVPLRGLMIGATHTHAGPGQFVGTDFYNRFASNRQGFDPQWAGFLVDQIVGAVEQAVDTRRPARAAVGTDEVWGHTRNRSLPPHARNEEYDDRTEIHRRYAEIEPRLHLIRVDEITGPGTTAPLAASLTFSIHGTGVSSRADEYNADLWSSVTGELAQRIEAETGARPVVAAIEGTHGDMTPAIRPGRAGYVEAERIGRHVGAAAAELHHRLADELTDDLELEAGFREVDLGRQRSIDGVTLPRRPAIGMALVAGAKENETPVLGRLWGFRAGSPRRRHHRHHGTKRVLFGHFFQRLYLPLSGFPRVIPLQLLRIGDSAVVGVPFEVTMGAGRRFEAAVKASLDGSGVKRVIVSSVANEYFGYVTTPDEYALQFYEGGHTLYGPQTQPFLEAHLSRLAAETITDGGVHDPLGRRDFDLRLGRFMPEAGDGEPGGRTIAGPPQFVDMSADQDAYWDLRWTGGGPAEVNWHEPIIAVESSDDGETWEPAADDGDGTVAVHHYGERRGHHDYAARWYRPDVRAGRMHRFLLLANNGLPPVRGEPFD
jgi:neutral ceramidase